MNITVVIVILILACAAFFIVKKQRDDSKKPRGESEPGDHRYAVEALELPEPGLNQWNEIRSFKVESAASGYASLHTRSQGQATRVLDRETDSILYQFP